MESSCLCCLVTTSGNPGREDLGAVEERNGNNRMHDFGHLLFPLHAFLAPSFIIIFVVVAIIIGGMGTPVEDRRQCLELDLTEFQGPNSGYCVASSPAASTSRPLFLKLYF